MSIIADTLQRLQTKIKDDNPDGSERPSIVRPFRGTREPGWHTRPSRLKLWLAGIGMIIGLSGLGLFAYWIGFHVDFGMSTYASPGNRHSLSSSVSSLSPETPPSDTTFSPSLPKPVVHPVQDVPSSDSLHSKEEPFIIQGAVLPETSFPQDIKKSFSAPPLMAIPDSSGEASQPSASAPRHLRSKSSSPTQATPTVSTRKIATAPTPTQEFSEPETADNDLPAASFIPSDRNGSNIAQSEEGDKLKNPAPVEIAIEGEHKDIRRGESSRTAHQSPDNNLLHATPSIGVPKIKEPPQPAQASVSGQPTSTDRLQQAQQFIHSGKYEKAVSFLSPLFQDLPDHWEPWFWMGTALLGQQRLEQADQYFLNGLARNDKIPQLWIQRALVAHQRGEYQLAIHELQRAESLDPGLPHTYLNLGYAYEKLGNDRLANEYYAKFLKVSEGNPAFFSTRKKLYAHFTEQIHSTSTSNSSLPSSLPEIP